MTLPATLLSHAQRTPDRVFLEIYSPSTPQQKVSLRVTYSQLADSMIAAALFLRDGIGITAGDYVALLAPNSVAYLSFSLGAMCLGAISINLNWRNPAEVNERLLQNLQPRLLLAGTPFRAEATAAHSKLGIRVALLESVCNMDGISLPFEPPPSAAAEEMTAAILSRLDPKKPAAVFFTGGTTGTPKAVPHSHNGLLWFAEACLKTIPDGFAPGVENAGTVCFTPFFHVMGFVANFVFNLHAGCRAFILADHDEKLSPNLILNACRDLRPSVLNTVPWVVEGLVAFLKAGNPSDAADVLSSLHLVTYGGAALAPHCGPILKQNGIVVCCTYGQTELAGPVMFGKPGGDPNALRPLSGVSFELKPSADDGPNEGELLLLHNASATSGYLRQPSETKVYRSLCDGKEAQGITPQERFSTNDRFTTKTIDGEAWLLYLCRADDLLVHTSGEMSNPLPTEQRMIAECQSLLSCVCVGGTNLPRCVALLELADGVNPDDENVRADLRVGLHTANSIQPQYARVLDQHALLLPHGSLPLTVKGTVQRGKAEKLYEKELKAALTGGHLQFPTLFLHPSAKLKALTDGTALPGSSSEDVPTVDSLNLTAAAGGGASSAASNPRFAFHSGLRCVLATWILCYHASSGTGMSLYGFTRLDGVLQRAYIGVSFFVVLAGFSTHLSFGPQDLLPKGPRKWRTYAHYALRRIDRVVLSYWVSLTWTIIVSAADNAQYFSLYEIVRCYTMLEWFLGGILSDKSWQPAFSGHCPDFPLWTIAALVLAWLLYPLMQGLIHFTLKRRAITTASGRLSLPPTALLVLTWGGTWALITWFEYILFAILPKHRDFGGVVHTWPVAYLPDFALGVCVAGLIAQRDEKEGNEDGSAKKNDDDEEAHLVDRSDSHLEQEDTEGGNGSSRPPASGFTAIVRKFASCGTARWYGILADVWMLFFILYLCFAPTSIDIWLEGNPEPELKLAATGNVGMGAHIYSPLIAIWVYLSAARDDGVGYVCSALNHPALTSLGNYALHVYLFSEPMKLTVEMIYSGRTWQPADHRMEVPNMGDTFPIPHKLVYSRVFVAYLFGTGFAAALYAHLVEEPLVQLFRRATDRCLIAPRRAVGVITGTGAGSEPPTGP